MIQKRMGRMMDTVRIRNYRVCNVLATCKMPFGVKIEEVGCISIDPTLSSVAVL